MEFKFVNLRPPKKSFKKDKDTGDISVVSHFRFDALNVDDETLMRITSLADSGLPVTVQLSDGGRLIPD